MRSPLLLLLLVFSLLLGPSYSGSGKVIYFNELNSSQSAEVAKTPPAVWARACSLTRGEIAADMASFATITAAAEGLSKNGIHHLAKLILNVCLFYFYLCASKEIKVKS
ncbi:uncharacterized protein LOC128265230 [Drosophila gunungcola]|uniref:uncharacterized protein LOC128265230 n=1 Tax=Drosophila gunungcola TaxID=103775 RepID=UPI0022E29C04|nr:uncharacterized protein LOC128265230 [Drosophila gunungcola]